MANNSRQLSKAKCVGFHREVSEDFRSLARIAQRHRLFDWWSDLNTISARLAGNDSEKWHYTLQNVMVELPPGAILWPQPSAAAFCRFTLEVAGALEMDSAANAVVSRITAFQANLEVEAIDGQSQKWYQFWHFDRHLGGQTPPEVHPLFHANFGGGRMASCRVHHANGIFQRVVEMPAPRLHLAPMDAFLFVDFIISNFDGAKWATARGDPGYVDLIAKAQNRYWRGYFRTLSDFFHQPRDKKLTNAALELWPNLALKP